MDRIQKNLDAINHPKTVDDLNIIEVLDVEFGIKAADINGALVLPEGISMPSDSDILAAKESLLQKYDNNLYGKKRRIEYPIIAEQLDALYHDIVNGTLTAETSTFVSLIQTVKDKYPKS